MPLTPLMRYKSMIVDGRTPALDAHVPSSSYSAIFILWRCFSEHVPHFHVDFGTILSGGEQ